MSGMRFKGLVGAMDVAAALDSLARGVAAGVIRHAPFGGESAPLEFSQTAHLSFKVSAHRDKAKIALKLRTGPRAGRDACPGDERCAFPPLAACAAWTDADAACAAHARQAGAQQAGQEEPHRLKLKAKGNAPVCEAAALIHGLAAGLAAGKLLLRTGDEEIGLAPGPVLKLSLKGKEASLGVKISWKPGMEDTAEPLPQLFTEPEAATAVTEPSARTDEPQSDDARPAPLPTSVSAPAAKCCVAPSAAAAPVAVPAATPAEAALQAAAPARRASSALASSAPSAVRASSAPSPASSSASRSPASSAARAASQPDDVPATDNVLPPEAGIPAQEAVAAIVAAVAAGSAGDVEERPAPRPKAAPAAPGLSAPAPAAPSARKAAKAPAATPAKQPRSAASSGKKARPPKTRTP